MNNQDYYGIGFKNKLGDSLGFPDTLHALKDLLDPFSSWNLLYSRVLQSNRRKISEAGTTAWIVFTTPVFMALLGWSLLRERLGWTPNGYSSPKIQAGSHITLGELGV